MNTVYTIRFPLNLKIEFKRTARYSPDGVIATLLIDDSPIRETYIFGLPCHPMFLMDRCIRLLRLALSDSLRMFPMETDIEKFTGWENAINLGDWREWAKRISALERD